MKTNPSVPDLQVYDHELAISIAGGSPEIAAELLALLIRELPDELEALHQAFVAGDLEGLRKLSHKLHGSASYCGTPALRIAAQDLEGLLPGATAEPIATAYAHLQEEIRRLMAIHQA